MPVSIQTQYAFKRRKQMRLGTSYYPEIFPRDQWERDYLKMAQAGIRTIRIAVLDWSRIQPEEGLFNWEWLDACIDLAEKHGINVIMGTPTTAPPIWLVEKYPEVLPVNEKGERMVFGKRQHRCYNSRMYWEYTKRLVEEMGKKYGDHPNVMAWQVDNEFGGERQRCYCENCEKAFQEYLAGKYDDIHALNERWGNAFWAEDYQNFKQIRVPLEINGQLWLKHNPGLELEFWRFSSQAIVEYSNFQVKLLRNYTDKLIMTNTDPFFYGDTVNIYDLFKEMDRVGIDVYSDQLYEIGFYSDVARSLKNNGTFWMSEFAVTSPNMYNELTQLQEMGCEFVGFFPMNPFPYGQEQSTLALLTLTGEATPNYELAKKWYQDHGGNPQRDERVYKTGIYYSFESSWTFSIASWKAHEQRFIYPIYVLHAIYKSLFEHQGNARILFNPADIQDLELLIVPKHILYDEALENALFRFVEAGGKLVVTDDTFKKNKDNAYLTVIPALYKKLMGWDGKSFIELNQISSDFVILENKVQKGMVWTVRSDGGPEQWKTFFDTKIAPCCRNTD